jgi:4-aminobutyrate aminotransferase
MVTGDTADVIERHGRIISTATRLAFYPLLVAGGEGAIVRDAEGREWIDVLASAAALNTGISHPAVVAAIQEQAARLPHYSAAYAFQQPMVELAEALAAKTPGGFDKRVAYGLSGGDSVDGAIKAARRFTGRQKIIGFHGSYHGTTYGALTLSSVNLDMRRGLGPFLPEVYHVPFPDTYHDPWRREPDAVGAACLAALDELLAGEVPAEEVAAVILEPIQGDSGVLVPPQSFLSGLKDRCERFGILFIVDEVQAGFGRTGEWFSIDHFGIEPDAVICGKAVSSGIPLSAIVARSEILSKWEPPAHTFSSGANLIGCAAALATIRIIEDERLVERARTLGDHLRAELESLGDNHDLIGDVRGKGLMLGIEIVSSRAQRTPAPTDTAKIAWRCWELGLLITFLRGNVLRVVPSLVITKDQLDSVVAILDQAISDVVAGRVSDESVAQLTGW